MKTIIVGIIPVSILFVYGFFHLAFYGWHIQTSQGQHTGYITSVERSGIFFKTNTVYLKTDTQSSQEDAYCVIDPQVYSQLETLSQQKSHVTVNYINYLSKGISYCNHEDAIIIGVQIDK